MKPVFSDIAIHCTDIGRIKFCFSSLIHITMRQVLHRHLRLLFANWMPFINSNLTASDSFLKLIQLWNSHLQHMTVMNSKQHQWFLFKRVSSAWFCLQWEILNQGPQQKSVARKIIAALFSSHRSVNCTQR